MAELGPRELGTRDFHLQPNLLFEQDQNYLWVVSQYDNEGQYCLIRMDSGQADRPAFLRCYYFNSRAHELVYEFKVVSPRHVFVVTALSGTVQDARFKSRFYLWDLEEQEVKPLFQKVFYELLFNRILFSSMRHRLLLLAFSTADPSTQRYYLVDSNSLRIVTVSDQLEQVTPLSQDSELALVTNTRRSFLLSVQEKRLLKILLLKRRKISPYVSATLL